jgi:tetratricopeptide (TPR) repeat protein
LKHRIVVLLMAAMAAASCTTVNPPPPSVAVEGEWRYLIDPRIGWSGTPTPAEDRQFNAAWASIVRGDYAGARKRLEEIRNRDANYGPAILAEAAIEIRQGRLDVARGIVDRLNSRHPGYTAAEVYAAEIDVAENRLRSAFERYRSVIERPNVPPVILGRYGELQTRLFEQLYTAAVSAQPQEAVRFLREALLVNPTASAARLLLAQKLIELKALDEARRELDPLVNSSEADRAEVQEALAEIEVGRGRYEEAIVRYERLARRDQSGRYARRLEEVKQQFAAANMPPQLMRAVEAESINRADLAVLLYWKVAAIRFAPNVPTPPIAIDIGEIPGRDEIIRAIALGIFQVDPVTRRVNPDALVTGSALARTSARVLTLRGAACARQTGSYDAILSACGVTNLGNGVGADLPVSGRMAAAVIEQVDRAISR